MIARARSAPPSLSRPAHVAFAAAACAVLAGYNNLAGLQPWHRAALHRILAEPAATAVASAVFGIWHVRPAAEALVANRLAPSRGARITAVAAVAAATAAAGALLSLLRDRSGSLAAPVLLHLAANCTAPLASALARTLDH